MKIEPRVFTIELGQDDPSKCTSAKMRKTGFATGISPRKIPRESIILNPLADKWLLPIDNNTALQHGIVVIDSSWNKSDAHFFNKFITRGARKLPALLAGNPTNYSILGKLSSCEAVSASLYIMGFKEEALRVVRIYKWGDTFLSLNQDPLEDYSKATSEQNMMEIQKLYFPKLFE